MLVFALAASGISVALADDKASLIATSEDGFGRMVLTFPGRLDLPGYRLKFDNGVLAIEFDDPIDISLPDVPVSLAGYVSVARVDPDGRGVRFGLRGAFNVNRLEAGERLFVDLLPPGWKGLPPALPPAIVAELAERAKQAAIVAEHKRKAEEAERVKPVATVRVGRNPTFLRIQFDWSADTKASFSAADERGVVTFDWPVDVDLYALKADLPGEITAVSNRVGPAGSVVDLRLAKGIQPRFYTLSSRQFVLDIDISRAAGLEAALAEEAAEEERRAAEAALAAETLEAESGAEPAQAEQGSIVPVVSSAGATIRLSFPFSRDTAAAVFRRGDTVWMFFDTPAVIEPLADAAALAPVARGMEIVATGTTKVVRLDLAQDRLATLGSEGRAWVLSLGDVLLSPTEPVMPRRQRDNEGRMAMLVDLQRPVNVHQFRDPTVGDMLQVVTAYPPARGIVRDLHYVDLSLLRSVHGLVVKPVSDDVQVAVRGTDAVLDAPDGLTMSVLEVARRHDSGNAPQFRAGYIDLGGGRETDPAKLVARGEAIAGRAAAAEGRQRDAARLELAHFLVANDLAYEAIGVLEVLEKDLRTEDLRRKARLTRSIADVLAGRPADALHVLTSDGFGEEADALMWRTIARTEADDFVGARNDAAAAEAVIDSYPAWIRSLFLLAGARAAIEVGDQPAAQRYLDSVDFASLDVGQVSEYKLLQARLADSAGRVDEALDTYGQVIAADIRPTRAEAVYRTLLLLDRTNRIDLARAVETLGAEALLWRGDSLEAGMQQLLADLYFRHKDYRLGFQTVRDAAATHPDNRATNALLAKAQDVFGELYLNGGADALPPVEALSVFYDFRDLTPPGNRGDEMIRNLVRRLVKLDLLAQAATLLEYQIDSRLKGIAQAQVAADLAVIHIANRNPEAALRALNRTRLAGLSPLLERQRRVLEARALIDAGRPELAVDLLSRVEGRDADLLRVDGYWKARNFNAAASLIETLYAPDRQAGSLGQPERMNIVRAAVGFTLANERLALSRLRGKFSEVMAQTPEWALFDLVTGEVSPNSLEFRQIAAEVAALDTVNAFLDTYRQIYGAADPVVPAGAEPAASV